MDMQLVQLSLSRFACATRDDGAEPRMGEIELHPTVPHDMERLRRELDRHRHQPDSKVCRERTHDDLGGCAHEIGMSDDDRSDYGAPDTRHDPTPDAHLLE